MIEERKRYIPEFKDIPSVRAKMAELPVEKRIKDFSEVEFVLEKDAATDEAKRCLSCRRCLGCKLCLAACEPKAIDFSQQEEGMELTVDSIVIAPGVEKIPAKIRKELGYGNFLNVVNGVEFETILREDGPYGGLILRPSDGEIPKAIAFIAEGKDALVYTWKEMAAAQKRFPSVTLILFSKDDPGKVEGIVFQQRKGDILEVKEKGENNNLLIQWKEDGKTKEEELEMVVVQTPLILSPETTKLMNQLDIPNPKPFWELLDTALVETGKENIFFTGGIGKTIEGQTHRSAPTGKNT
jgi:heterodisulfide reductase subunit A-like polyferredoxin